MGDVDLGALQQQLQQQRSTLADDIMARLPQQKTSTNTTRAEPARRSATLGVGAKSEKTSYSAADQKLRAQLGGKGKKRAHEAVREEAGEEEDDAGKAAAVSKAAPRRRADPFAAAEAKHKAAKATLPPEVEGMSKNQRKKWNKKQRLEAEKSEGDEGSNGKAEASKEVSKEVTKEASKGASKETPVPAKAPTPSKVSAASAPAPAAPAAPSIPAAPSTPSTPSDASAPLTALQSSMLTSLKGARFRSINERLYTNGSREARSFMLAEPHLFDEYHDGFRQQVRKWPTNPVDRLADLLLGEMKKKGPAHTMRAAQLPGALIVDCGAGEAGLAQKLAPSGKHILSYDLLDTPDGWVRGVDAAQIGALPLPGVAAPLGLLWAPPPAVQPAMADVCVFCLSLMGTNWVEMIAEAWRILRVDGELLVAEVASRLGSTGSTDAFVALISALGFRLDWADTSNTHFVLVKFTKEATQRTPAPPGALDASASPAAIRSAVGTSAQAAEAQQMLIAQGASVLKPCLYKRR